jgi:hypothetical protein
MEAGEI